jgi:hypothetical protein
VLHCPHPLNSVLGFAQIIARNPHISTEERENLSVIQRSGEHLLALINQILDLYGNLGHGNGVVSALPVKRAACVLVDHDHDRASRLDCSQA